MERISSASFFNSEMRISSMIESYERSFLKTTAPLRPLNPKSAIPNPQFRNYRITSRISSNVSQ